MTELCLSVQGLVVVRDSHTVLDLLDLDVAQSEVIGLVGRNGAGKSTLLQAIAGTIHATAGAMLFLGQRIERWPVFRRAQAGIAQIPQEHAVFRNLSAVDNLRAGHPDWRAASDDVARALSIIGFAASTEARYLSGGQQRKLAIARALSRNARLLLVDEPELGLPSPSRLSVILDLLRVARAFRAAALIASHERSLLTAHCDRVVELDKGRVIASNAMH